MSLLKPLVDLALFWNLLNIVHGRLTLVTLIKWRLLLLKRCLVYTILIWKDTSSLNLVCSPLLIAALFLNLLKLVIAIIWMKIWRKDALIRSMTCNCRVVISMKTTVLMMIFIIDSICGSLCDDNDVKLGYYFGADLLGSLLTLTFLFIYAWFASMVCFLNQLDRYSMFL